MLTQPLKLSNPFKKTTWLYALCIVTALWFSGWALYPAARTLTHGFGAYYSAARLLRQGRLSAQVYDPAFFRPVVREDSHGLADDIYSANPPTTSLLFWPLSFLSIETARVIWTAANAAMLLGGLALLVFTFTPGSAARGPTLAAVFALGMLFQPVLQNIRFGQAYLLIFLLLALATAGLQRERPGAGGGALAVALCLKTAGWALLPFLAWQRRWRYLAWTLTVAAAILLLTLPFFPLSMWASYLRLLGETGSSPSTCATAYQTARSFLCRLFVFDETWSGSPLADLPWLATAILVALAGLTLAANFRLARRDETAAFLAMIIWGTIFAPLGEQHHHTPLLIPLTWLVASWHTEPPARRPPRAAKIAGLAAILLYLLPFPIGQPPFESGGWVLLAYPRLYAAWLLLFAVHWWKDEG